MFKFIHAADVHLDSPLRGLARYESAPADAIRDACRRAFCNLVDLAIAEQVAFVLLAGDLYDGDWKDFSTGIFLSRQVGRLGQHNIPVVTIFGNHDAVNHMSKALDSPKNMTVLSARKAETVRLDQVRVAIHGRSFDERHVDENLVAGFAPAQAGWFNIGLLHTSLDGREGHAVYAPCSVGELRAKGYQYWALGHVHKQEVVAEDPWIVFPGCIQGRHIRENGPKGCALVTVEEGAVSQVEAVPLDVFRWVLCRVDLTDADNLTAALERARAAIVSEHAAADGRPVAMRIRFEGATPIADELAADPTRIEQQLKMIAAEAVGEDLWIERVEQAVASKRELTTALSDDSAFGRLLKEILAAPGEPLEIDGLKEMLVDLRQRVPAEAFAADSGLNLGDQQTVQRLIEEARHMLIGRLLTAGGGK